MTGKLQHETDVYKMSFIDSLFFFTSTDTESSESHMLRGYTSYVSTSWVMWDGKFRAAIDNILLIQLLETK